MLLLFILKAIKKAVQVVQPQIFSEREIAQFIILRLNVLERITG